MQARTMRLNRLGRNKLTGADMNRLFENKEPVRLCRAAEGASWRVLCLISLGSLVPMWKLDKSANQYGESGIKIYCVLLKNRAHLLL
jgi:hypothetical protein